MMTRSISIRVRHRMQSLPYSIVIGRNILPHILLKHPLISDQRTHVFIVADAKLESLAYRITKAFKQRCAGSIFLHGGESTKNISTLPKLYQATARAHLDRQSIVIVIGGGVIGDVVGFFAATYLRGIRIIHIPTTLVAQVDSAIGGKTGINLPEGKNLVGSFHQPSLVLIDPSLLNTLPEREFRSGLAEVIKYGVIADSDLFQKLEHRSVKILQRDPAELTRVIARCCAIKAQVVSRDECETTGLRSILNFGHTIGHGIESTSHYSLLHGEAIALGMIAASYLSEKILGLPPSSGQRIRNLIQQMGLPIQMKKTLSSQKILAAMRSDKKVSNGKIRFALTPRLGTCQTGITVTPHLILQTLALLKAENNS